MDLARASLTVDLTEPVGSFLSGSQHPPAHHQLRQGPHERRSRRRQHRGVPQAGGQYRLPRRLPSLQGQGHRRLLLPLRAEPAAISPSSIGPGGDCPSSTTAWSSIPRTSRSRRTTTHTAFYTTLEVTVEVRDRATSWWRFRRSTPYVELTPEPDAGGRGSSVRLPRRLSSPSRRLQAEPHRQEPRDEAVHRGRSRAARGAGAFGSGYSADSSSATRRSSRPASDGDGCAPGVSARERDRVPLDGRHLYRGRDRVRAGADLERASRVPTAADALEREGAGLRLAKNKSAPIRVERRSKPFSLPGSRAGPIGFAPSSWTRAERAGLGARRPISTLSPRTSIARAGFVFRHSFNTECSRAPGAGARAAAPGARRASRKRKRRFTRTVAAENPDLVVGEMEAGYRAAVFPRKPDEALELLLPLADAPCLRAGGRRGAGSRALPEERVFRSGATTSSRRSPSVRRTRPLLNALGDSYQNLGQHDKARESFERSLALNPGQEAVKIRLDTLAKR